MHETYPLGLRLDGRRVVVVGGGPVAARRARGLLDAGAVVTVVAPYVCEDLAELLATHGPGTAGHAAHAPAAVPARDARLSWMRRDYLTGDLDGAWLVHTATGDARVDAEVAADAEADRVFCVTAGDAERATAWVPAVARTLVPGASGAEEGEVTVAVNAGRDPRRAQRVRDAVAVLLETGEL
ncbi:uroporphyrinogen-III C-methyltransferase, partial [Cellulosimicrobium cellulans]|nr:uroporphyrinogen-III C-methyltransferase [Cellulosimicrobium cellulans]